MDRAVQLTETESSPVVVRRCRPAARPGSLRTALLHGLGCSRVWAEFVARASPGLDLWEVELPWGARGSKEWALDPDVHRWAAQALEMVEGGVDAVIAHSFGANALLELFDRVGQGGIRAVVLVSPFYRAAQDGFDWSTLSYYVNRFDSLLEEAVRVQAGSRLHSKVQWASALRLRDRIGPQGWIRFFDTYLRTPRLRTAHLAGPFLIVGGAQDYASSPADSEALARALPNSRVEILAHCGHFAMAEQADAFADLVNGFIAPE